MKNLTSAVILFSILGVIFSSATDEKKDLVVSKSNILNLFHQVKIGNTRESVEKILGDPIFAPLVQKDGSCECWYVDKREGVMQLHGDPWAVTGVSPWGWGGIVVDYDKGGKVVSAKYNYQWVEAKHIQEYRRNHMAEGADDRSTTAVKSKSQ